MRTIEDIRRVAATRDGQKSLLLAARTERRARAMVAPIVAVGFGVAPLTLVGRELALGSAIRPS